MLGLHVVNVGLHCDLWEQRGEEHSSRQGTHYLKHSAGVNCEYSTTMTAHNVFNTEKTEW